MFFFRENVERTLARQAFSIMLSYRVFKSRVCCTSRKMIHVTYILESIFIRNLPEKHFSEKYTRTTRYIYSF